MCIRDSSYTHTLRFTFSQTQHAPVRPLFLVFALSSLAYSESRFISTFFLCSISFFFIFPQFPSILHQHFILYYICIFRLCNDFRPPRRIIKYSQKYLIHVVTVFLYLYHKESYTYIIQSVG